MSHTKTHTITDRTNLPNNKKQATGQYIVVLDLSLKAAAWIGLDLALSPPRLAFMVGEDFCLCNVVESVTGVCSPLKLQFPCCCVCVVLLWWWWW